ITTKDLERDDLLWETIHEAAFFDIKAVVITCKCLTVIDHELLAPHRIFVKTDASHHCSGTVLSLG
ncbi:hypothetical protein GYMLUDRAFT_137652, partial [Collybiopsis luxurians FD-317 M1]